MLIEITTAQLINQDGPDIAKDVDRIAMALFEALLNSAKRSSRGGDGRGPGAFDEKEYKDARKRIREQLVEKDGALVHLLYWFDARGKYWETALPDADPSDILQALRELLDKAEIIKVAAEAAQARARATPGDSGPLSAAKKTIDAIVQLAVDQARQANEARKAADLAKAKKRPSEPPGAVNRK
jgi:hypothetical protein